MAHVTPVRYDKLHFEDIVAVGKVRRAVDRFKVKHEQVQPIRELVKSCLTVNRSASAENTFRRKHHVNALFLRDPAVTRTEISALVGF